MQQKQTAQYAMFFKVFRDEAKYLTGVTFWNIADHYSWLDTYNAYAGQPCCGSDILITSIFSLPAAG